MIYLDNAATGGFKPPAVLKSVSYCLQNPANPSRSGHKKASFLAEKIVQLRENICELTSFNNPSRVILTKNCTESLNMAIFGLNMTKGRVITTVNEHNSVLRPLAELKRRGQISLDIVEPKDKMSICLDDILPYIKEDTCLIVTNHVSNVTGAVCDIKNIGKKAKDLKIPYLVDGAQSGGYLDLNMKDMDMLALPGHKGLHCPMGCGFLIVKDTVNLSPITFGGTGSSSLDLTPQAVFPESFEAGTPPLTALCGAVEGTDYVLKNKNKIRDKMLFFKKRIKELNTNDKIITYSIDNNCGLFSFNIKGYEPQEVAEILDRKFNIATRAGLTCAPLVHKMLKTTDNGVVRASFSSFNNNLDVDFLFKCLNKF